MNNSNASTVPPNTIFLNTEQTVALLLKEVESLKNTVRQLETSMSFLKAELADLSAQQFQAAIQHEVGGTDA